MNFGTIPLRILLIEDNPLDAKLIVRELHRGGFDVQMRLVGTPDGLAEALNVTLWDMILCDHTLPKFDSTTALRMVKACQPDVPFIIVSGTLPEDSAAQAMMLGAQDFLSKDNLARLVPAVKRELQDSLKRRALHLAEQALSVNAEEMRIGREIQQRLFPAAPPVLEGFDIAGASWPADATGGDYFDYIPMQHEQWGIVVGDVSGHGLGPALIMTDAHAIFRTLARSSSDVCEIMGHVNDLLLEDIGRDRFLTVLFGRLNPSSRQLQFMNAGHTAGVLLDSHGQVKMELNATLPALGLFQFDKKADPVTLNLEPGQLLVLLTDGVIEALALTGEEFGSERAIAVVRAHRTESAAHIVQALYAAVREFSENQPQDDDITMVIIKVRAEGEQEGG